MTAEEYALIAFLLGETEQAPAPAVSRVPRRESQHRPRIRLERYAPPPVRCDAPVPCISCKTQAG